MDLERFRQLIDAGGELVVGCFLPLEDVSERLQPQSYCLVRDWTILDVETTDLELKELQTRGLQPVVVYALQVVFDSRGRFNSGDWVRSSFLLSYKDGGLFFTKNTVYVLLGNGARQKISVQDLGCLR